MSVMGACDLATRIADQSCTLGHKIAWLSKDPLNSVKIVVNAEAMGCPVEKRHMAQALLVAVIEQTKVIGVDHRQKPSLQRWGLAR